MKVKNKINLFITIAIIMLVVSLAGFLFLATIAVKHAKEVGLDDIATQVWCGENGCEKTVDK